MHDFKNMPMWSDISEKSQSIQKPHLAPYKFYLLNALNRQVHV